MGMVHTRMKEMPEADRPRERLATHGASVLTDAELLAVMIGSGIPGANAVQLSGRLIHAFGGLPGLARASVSDLQQHKGIGHAKACHLAAAFGLGSRLTLSRLGSIPLDTPQRIYELVAEDMRHLRVESLRVLLVNARCRLIKIEEVSQGSVNESVAHPREIFRPVISHAAFGFVLVHNHPSGDPSPSDADIRITRKLADGASLLQLNFFDHLIVGTPGFTTPTGYFSFKEHGII